MAFDNTVGIQFITGAATHIGDIDVSSSGTEVYFGEVFPPGWSASNSASPLELPLTRMDLKALPNRILESGLAGYREQ